jgi:hypothetical protein
LFFSLLKEWQERLADHQGLFSRMLGYIKVSKMEGLETERVSARKAMEILKREGLEVTESQASQILQFLEKLANIVVGQCLKDLKDGVL